MSDYTASHLRNLSKLGNLCIGQELHELILRCVFVGFQVKSQILVSDFNKTQNPLILRRSRSWPIIGF
jgi:hypothetical protein